MPLPVLHAHPDCRACDLHVGARAIGMRTAYVRACGAGPAGERPALMILGERPGAAEDQTGVPFAPGGRSGALMRGNYIHRSGFSRLARVYVNNVVRCMPPGAPGAKQTKACLRWLLEDLELLRASHPEVLLLLTGAAAVTALTGHTALRKVWTLQGEPLQVGEHAYRTWYTFHPMALVGSRDPGQRASVADHLRLLNESLVAWPDVPARAKLARRAPERSEDPTPTNTQRDEPKQTSPRGQRVSLDIETYGVWKGVKQTQFHPMRSERIDGVPRDDCVVAVGMSWWADEREEDFEGRKYWWKSGADRKRLREDLAEVSGIVGHNLLFDLMYLRHFDLGLRDLLDKRYVAGDLALWDTSISSYLHSDVRPEKSLKALRVLLGLGRFERTAADQFERGEREAVEEYCLEDTRATLAVEKRLHELIDRRYGVGTAKNSSYCRGWYSELLWAVLFMAERGVAHDLDALRAVQTEAKETQWKLQGEARERWGAVLAGKGADKDLRRRVWAIVDKLPAWVLLRLKRTKVDKKIGVDRYNLQVLSALAEGEDREYMQMVLAFKRARKIDTTYCAALIGDKPTRCIDRICYPGWFVVPSYLRDEGEQEGGTRQSRLACANPPKQQEPGVIRNTFASRWGKDGVLLAADLSQIELRMAALLSGDPGMMQAFIDGHDLHYELATRAVQLLLRCDIAELEEAKRKEWRQICKRTNFLTLYWGQAEKLVLTLWQDGINLLMSQARVMLAWFWETRQVLRAWQEGLIEEVRRQGYLELPLIGQSRLFARDKESIGKQSNIIVNQPVQTLSSNVLFSSHTHTERRMREANMRGGVVLSRHDDLLFDVPLAEEQETRRLIDRYYRAPPFWTDLCSVLGRSIPLDYKIERRVHG